MRRLALPGLLLGLLAPVALTDGPALPAAVPGPGHDGSLGRVIVLLRAGADLEAGRRAVAAAGGRVVSANAEVGSLEVAAPEGFVGRVLAAPVVQGAARDRVVGATPARLAARTPARATGPARGAAATATGAGVAAVTAPAAGASTGEPLAAYQWDMQAMRTAEARARHRVSKRVLVAVIDTGVDGSHPDLAGVLDRALSRNFTTDVPVDPGGTPLDGPCEVPGCVDPVDRDDDGHGTHVASTVAAPVDGLGIAGVAPGARVVSLRAGQDSGWFFVQPVVDAITHAGRIGVDVASLSFFVDPWLFHCSAHPEDSPEEQQEQRTIVAAVQRAVDSAHKAGVTLLAAAGNQGHDLGAPGTDTTSPDYPQGRARLRVLDDATCLSMPSEAAHVLDVTATGPSGRKAAYSSYGVQQAVVAAPGGDALDAALPWPRRMVLGAYPREVLARQGLVRADGTPADPTVVRDCQGSRCGWYRWLEGTSMAAPHAVGVAALLVSRHGGTDARHRDGLTLRPTTVERLLRATAVDRACPDGGLQRYEDGRTARCEGTPASNGFFGDGQVDALRAVSWVHPVATG